MPPLILASQSPRRKDWLSKLGIPFTVQPADVDERSLPKEKPLAYVKRVAMAKAEAVARQNPGATVLACDTPVICGQRILQTPQTADEAAAMLRLQAGRRVHTPSAIVVRCADGKALTATVDAWVKFKPMSEAEIQAYVNMTEPEWQGVSGGWRIQGLAASWAMDARGAASAIMGLPLYETAQLLRKAGYTVLGC